MSFENSQVSYVHLVSFPSCWLPPKNTKKLLIVGCDQAELETHVPIVQELYPDLSFAFYFVPELNYSSLEQLDWLFINQHHIDAAWVKITDWQTLAIATVFRCRVAALCQSSLQEIIKFMENCTLPQQTFVEFVGQVCQQEAKQP